MKTISALSFFVFLCISKAIFGQHPGYKDGRPVATKRMACEDQGIVLRYGDGPDSCDVFGAREAIVNKENGSYYLFYDGAGKDGWIACQAKSNDLKTWTKKGPIFKLGGPGSSDAKSASSPWVIQEGNTWHMFYLGTPNTTTPPDRIPAFPYLTMKASARSLEGPWTKQYNVTPFFTKKGSFYSVTASPGFIVKSKTEYLQFFSGALVDSTGIKRTLGIARTNDLNRSWAIDTRPIFPTSEQVENSSLYFEQASKTWFLFTDHIGIDSLGREYTDAVWVYWSGDLNRWDTAHKAVVLDATNCTWSKGVIGMPSVIKDGDRLALLYDGYEGYSTGHMKRNIGLAWLTLPLQIPE